MSRWTKCKFAFLYPEICKKNMQKNVSNMHYMQDKMQICKNMDSKYTNMHKSAKNVQKYVINM